MSLLFVLMNGNRLRSEYRKLQNSKTEGIQLFPNEDDLFEWKCVMGGPAGTPYEGGTYRIRLASPEDYPFRPPNAFFETPIFHPNIDYKTGSVCLNILKDAWSPLWGLEVILFPVALCVECCNINTGNAVYAEHEQSVKL